LASPFIYNTVGRDNYKYFVSILLVHPIAFGLFMITTICYWLREPLSWLCIMFMVYSFLFAMAICGLTWYHLRLSMTNLTTNEEINAFRYAYLKNEFNMGDNPYDRHSPSSNFWDSMFPTTKLYYNRDDVKRDLAQGITGDEDEEQAARLLNGGGGHGGADAGDEGYFEEAKSKQLP
jgi:hypothetical protein